MTLLALCVFKPAERDTVFHTEFNMPILKRMPPHSPESATDRNSSYHSALSQSINKLTLANIEIQMPLF